MVRLGGHPRAGRISPGHGAWPHVGPVRVEKHQALPGSAPAATHARRRAPRADRQAGRRSGVPGPFLSRQRFAPGAVTRRTPSPPARRHLAASAASRRAGPAPRCSAGASQIRFLYRRRPVFSPQVLLPSRRLTSGIAQTVPARSCSLVVGNKVFPLSAIRRGTTGLRPACAPARRQCGLGAVGERRLKVD
jgi:hypothetical protein